MKIRFLVLKSNSKKHDFYLLRSGKIGGQFRSREHFYSMFERSCFKLSLNGFTSRGVNLKKTCMVKKRSESEQGYFHLKVLT